MCTWNFNGVNLNFRSAICWNILRIWRTGKASAQSEGSERTRMRKTESQGLSVRSVKIYFSPFLKSSPEKQKQN